MSAQRNDGGPAFPVPRDAPCDGVSLRDYLAAKAMQGFLAGHVAHYGHENHWRYADMAGDAYQVADAMLKAREGGSRPECEAAAAEIERLRAERADLLDALLVAEGSVGDSYALKVVRAAIAKLEGGAA